MLAGTLCYLVIQGLAEATMNTNDLGRLRIEKRSSVSLKRTHDGADDIILHTPHVLAAHVLVAIAMAIPKRETEGGQRGRWVRHCARYP